MDFKKTLQKDLESGALSDKIFQLFFLLYQSYVKTLKDAGIDYKEHAKLFFTYLDLVKKQIAHPYAFEPYHKKNIHPFDHHRFGVELFRPLVDKAQSVLEFAENLKRMQTQLEAGENVILFANHQTEVDPQLINIILETCYPQMAADMIFVAGDRVITDPIAVPISQGCNMLCIYSKRYIDIPPDKKEQKLLHNSRTMKKMSELLSEGGKIIYVAPSGGRDRAYGENKIKLADFDPNSIEMFRLMAKQASRPTHFYPLSLKTYYILPPPSTIQVELGEIRIVSRQPVYFAFGNEIDMNHFPGSDEPDRHALRQARANHIFECVKNNYDRFP